MKNSESMPLGIVLERRRIDHPWQEHAWRPVAVIPGAPRIDSCRLLRGGQGWAQYHAATLAVELFPKETEGYRVNLSQRQPVVYVVLHREGGPIEDAPRPFHATVSAEEARDYSETGEEIVEPVPMPDAVAAWVKDYVARYHVDRPFEKRKRKPADPRKAGVGGPPPGGPGGRRDG